jgi:hypothetical protein
MKKMDRQTTSPSLKFIVCGLEHSGTTLASDLFREHPACDSGFECGVLLADTPQEFQHFPPFYNNMLKGWGLQKEELAESCQTDSYNDFYEAIMRKSRTLIPKKATIIFDKTPRYITRISHILSTTRIPIIAMIKDPRAIAASDFKRAKIDLSSIDSWYETWAPRKLSYMRRAYEGYLKAWTSNRCEVIRLEDLCLNTRETFERLYSHADLEPSLSYLTLKQKRYSNTKGSSIDPSSCISFREILPGQIEKRVVEDFSELDRWFYDFGPLSNNC